MTTFPTSSLKVLLLGGSGRGRGLLPSSLLSLSLLLLLVLCGNEVNADDTTIVADAMNVDEYYNVNETRGEFEFRIQPYPIPIETTTYVDFLFSLPDDLPPLVHIVFGEPLISQPKHLHHFVLLGCPTKLDADVQEGVPVDRPPGDCTIPLGQWAPGSSVFGTTPDLSVGVAIGKAMGVQAVQLNVHYTDGEYEDDGELEESYKMATDGIKVYYTTDLRDYTSMTKELISVPFGPSEFYIPPSTERYFVTRTCVVDTKCKDASDKQLQGVASLLGFTTDTDSTDTDADTDTDTDDDTTSDMNEMLANLSCPTMKSFCSYSSSEFGPLVQQLCPVTCGLCSNNDNDGNKDSVNPRNPTSYRATSINYHAHLLGSEMYATLLRREGEGEGEGGGGDRDREEEDKEQEVALSLTQRQADLSTTSNMIVKDLKSSEFWNFDNQESTAMDKEYEIRVGTSTSTSTSTTTSDSIIELVRGVEIRAGDKIQATCVYNSMYNEKKTRFGLSTYDEMCIIGLQITFKTPPIIVVDDETTALGIDFRADLNLRTFSCVVMDDDSINEDNDNDNDNDNDSDNEDLSRTPLPALSDVWQGTLDINEDPRNIWEDHPITTTDLCTFPVADYVLFDAVMTMESRNCPPSSSSSITDDNDYDHDSSSICYGFEIDNNGNSGGTGSGGSGKIEFLDDIIAGYTCVGGTYDEKDSNEAPLYLTEEECLVDGGGISYDAYTCSDVQEFFITEAILSGIPDEVKQFLKEDWYQPSCCREVVEVEVEVAVSSIEDEDDGGVIGNEDKGGDDDPSSYDTVVATPTTTASFTTTTTTAEEESSSSSTYSSAAFGYYATIVLLTMTTITTIALY